jgi:hypothetical protein
MSRGSFTAQPGEKPIRREYLLGVGVDEVGVEGMMGEVVVGEYVNDEDGSVMFAGTVGDEYELEGAREDGGEKVDIVGRTGGIAGDETDVLEFDVLSQTSKLT